MNQRFLKNSKGERSLKFRRSAWSISLAALMLVCFLAPASFAAGPGFSDVRGTDWFADAVAQAVSLGLVNGRGLDENGENHFDPDGNITLAEAVKLAACIRQLCTEGTVTLSSGDPWYESYAAYGRGRFLAASDAEAGFSYESVMERPDHVINRAEFAWLFARAVPAEFLPEVNSVPDNAIPDVRNDREYRSDDQAYPMRYYEEIYRLYRAGILNGSDRTGSFLPASPIRRSEVAAIVVRIAEPYRRVGPPELLRSGAWENGDPADCGWQLAALAASLPPDPDCPVGDFSACADLLDPEKAEAVLREAPETALAFRAAFRRAFGVTPLAFQMQPDAACPTGEGTLVFTGDICFADNWYSMEAYRQRGCDITRNIPEPLLGILRAADVCVMNCEFSMSLRGAPLEGKAYTFRGDPANAALFSALGCDLVSLANNHVYDFGRDAFLDTLDALDTAGIARIGAGKTLSEAKEYRAFIVGGAKIGFVAASNAEINRMTPGATEYDPGILLMYDPAEFCDALDRARAECDFVCAVVHWGTENSTEINWNQREYTALFAAHGAGLIAGHHPHVLQPVEIASGIPVAYSLGNFWFNLETLDTGVLWVDLAWDDRDGVTPTATLIPCVQSNGVTNVANP